MARKRTQIGKLLVPALVFLLLCGIVAGEFPELLSLTDNATNDFSVIQTKSAALPVHLRTRSLRPATDINCNNRAPILLFSRLRPFEEATSTRLGRSTLHLILRT
jgi:hypothetical protein